MRHHWSGALRPIAVGAAALGLTVGVLGAGAGVAGAATHAKHAKSVYQYPKYVGGHGKANNSLSPVTIGIVSEQTSTDSITPTAKTAAEIGVKYVNEHAGGIDGHPLKAVYCIIPTTTSAATTCGQEFTNDSKISAVVAAGAIDVGNTPLEAALKTSNKPIFFGVSLSTVDEKDPDAFILYNTGTQVEAPMATVAVKTLHAKSISLVYPSDVPGNVYQAGVVDAALKFDGVKTIFKVGFTTADTDLTEPFEAAHVGSTTLFILVNSGGPACSNAYLTMKSLGITTYEKNKVLVNVPCDTPTVATADGGTLPHDWYYLTADPLPGSKTKALTAMTKLFKGYGKAPLALNAWYADTVGQILTVAKLDTQILKAHKKVTPNTVKKAAKAFRGPIVQGAPHLHCGGFKGTPATCNDLDRFFQNTAPNVMTAIGTWIPPPKGFKAPLT